MIATTKLLLHKLFIAVEALCAIAFLISSVLFFDAEVKISLAHKIFFAGLSFSLAFICNRIARRLKK